MYGLVFEEIWYISLYGNYQLNQPSLQIDYWLPPAIFMWAQFAFWLAWVFLTSLTIWYHSLDTDFGSLLHHLEVLLYAKGQASAFWKFFIRNNYFYLNLLSFSIQDPKHKLRDYGQFDKVLSTQVICVTCHYFLLDYTWDLSAGLLWTQSLEVGTYSPFSIKCTRVCFL